MDERYLVLLLKMSLNVIPEAVINGIGITFFMTGKIIPVLAKAIQEQQALIKALEQRILILENK
jgi:hypothetical protein